MEPCACGRVLGTVHKASTDKAFAWYAGSLAQSTVNGTARLHTVFTRDVIGGEKVNDDGPRLGVYYERGSANGTNWGTASASTRRASTATTGRSPPAGGSCTRSGGPRSISRWSTATRA